MSRASKVEAVEAVEEAEPRAPSPPMVEIEPLGMPAAERSFRAALAWSW